MSQRLLLAGLTTGLSAFTFNAWAQTVGEGGYHPHMWGYSGYGGGFFHGPLMVILTIVILVLVVMGVSRLMGGCGRHRCGHRRGSSSAMAILEERYAKGEIDKAEFEERKNTLGS